MVLKFWQTKRKIAILFLLIIALQIILLSPGYYLGWQWGDEYFQKNSEKYSCFSPSPKNTTLCNELFNSNPALIHSTNHLLEKQLSIFTKNEFNQNYFYDFNDTDRTNEFYQVTRITPFGIQDSSPAAVAALGIGYGDEVIVSPYTMTACAMAPLLFGAIPVFSDVEKETGCMDVKSIERALSNRTKAILVVHQFGIPADMDKIMELAKQHDLKVIEDCAQAHGAKYNNKFVGTFGAIGVFSLNVNKSIQTGEGGICITDDEELAYRLALIRNHGEAVVGPAKYANVVNIFGFNFRLTELQAAIAREQLKKINKLNDHRLDLVETFSRGLDNHPFLHPLSGRSGCYSTYYVCPLRYESGIARVEREEFVAALNAEGAQFYQGYVEPLYLQPLYQQQSLFKHSYPFSAPENRGHTARYEKGTCSVAELLHQKTMIINEHIRFPHKKRDIEQLIQIVIKVTG